MTQPFCGMGGIAGIQPPFGPARITAGTATRLLLMSRNFYILAATLLLFALLSGGMTLVPSSFQPGLPANGSLWRTLGLLLLLGALACGLIGMLSHLFEQVDRRSEDSRLARRQERRRNRRQNP